MQRAVRIAMKELTAAEIRSFAALTTQAVAVSTVSAKNAGTSRDILSTRVRVLVLRQTGARKQHRKQDWSHDPTSRMQ